VQFKELKFEDISPLAMYLFVSQAGVRLHEMGSCWMKANWKWAWGGHLMQF